MGIFFQPMIKQIDKYQNYHVLHMYFIKKKCFYRYIIIFNKIFFMKKNISYHISLKLQIIAIFDPTDEI